MLQQPYVSCVLAQVQGQGNLLDFLKGMAPLIVIIIAFFWLMNRSQRKKEEKRQQMLDSIKPKDRVVTIGGIRGKVVNVKDDTFILRIDDEKDVKITISRTGVSRPLDSQEGDALPS